MPSVGSIFASTLSGGIGVNGKLPWRIPEDLHFFEKITKGSHRKKDNFKQRAVIMGRRTFESLPGGPLKDRISFVITSKAKSHTQDDVNRVFYCASLQDALDKMKEMKIDTGFVTGGAGIYNEAHGNELPDRIYWTRVCGPAIQTDTQVDLDLLLQHYDVVEMSKTKGDGKHTYDFLTLERKSAFEVKPKLKSIVDENERDDSALGHDSAVTSEGGPRQRKLCGIVDENERLSRTLRADEYVPGETVARQGSLPGVTNENQRTPSKVIRDRHVDHSSLKDIARQQTIRGILNENERKSITLSAEDIAFIEQEEAYKHLPSLADALPTQTDRSISTMDAPLMCLPPPLKRIRHLGHQEAQYLAIMNDIIENGVESDDRTGVGTFCKFGTMMRFDLRESFPLLTTKKVYWKGVVEELLWFLKGETDAKKLAAKNVHIWDANGSKDFLTSRGLGHREEGDLGPVYGFQWRHFGAQYGNCRDDYRGQGFDQVLDVMNQIKKDPNSRRLIISAWNPAALRDMALPPCHMMSQFYVDPKKKELSCLMFQRSGDWGLGIPFNIASYSLLCLIIAKLTGLKPGEFVHCIGNAHVYKNHVAPLKEQLQRLPRPFPRVEIADALTKSANFEEAIEKLDAKHFKLIGYDPWPAIKMDMAV
eukprot:Gregarina_sp_Pseudo_9__5235@NODE_58_length_4716_cov_37_865298_g54_i0_p1_GENE_NODE_58_length_4716_cov_37_865298_g54_i0NODE_58_length_4716_cov_37_865298_g54_i0_p1_ORF_typecomplete_len649_score167_84Thymidylat_synt/PF00303_19/5_5e106DHFR_1/PF00186_19/9_1e34RibD_C/PF01872_17/0_0049RibD_C/PF01872_17/2_1e03_NODE_58_length_4716_cov_37_865298_g54_i025854531